MYKTDVVRQVASATGLSQRVVSQVVTATLTTVQGSLAAGERVSFPGFGTFYTNQLHQPAASGSGALRSYPAPG